MDLKQEIIEFLQREFPQFIHTIEEVGDQAATVRYKVGADALRPGGTVSGPTLFGIADSAMYVAVLGEIGIVPLAVTTNMNINFLRKPSAEQDVIGTCKLLKVGRSLAVGEITMYSDGDPAPVAHAVGTYAIPNK